MNTQEEINEMNRAIDLTLKVIDHLFEMWATPINKEEVANVTF